MTTLEIDRKIHDLGIEFPDSNEHWFMLESGAIHRSLMDFEPLDTYKSDSVFPHPSESELWEKLPTYTAIEKHSNDYRAGGFKGKEQTPVRATATTPRNALALLLISLNEK